VEKTFSPLQAILPEHTSPEMRYLEVKWSSLLPYQVGCDLLHDVPPVSEKLSAVTMRNHLLEVAERMEQELGEERPSLIEGCEQDWEQLPIPDGPLTVGLDGGFVRARHKRGCFEVIAARVCWNSNGTTRKPRNPRSASASCRPMMASRGGGCSSC
jgi:hypothetical protein